jgi:hypothetical protein
MIGSVLKTAHPGQLVRPAGAGKTVMEVVEVRLWDVDPERPDLGVRAPGLSHGTALSSRFS